MSNKNGPLGPARTSAACRSVALCAQGPHRETYCRSRDAHAWARLARERRSM